MLARQDIYICLDAAPFSTFIHPLLYLQMIFHTFHRLAYHLLPEILVETL